MKDLAAAVYYNERDGEDGEYHQEQILDCCSNLLYADQKNTVHFAHLSVKEYLQNKHAEYSSDEANEECAITCLDILLNYGTIQSFSTLPGSFASILLHAWPVFCRHSLSSGTRQPTTFVESEDVCILQPGFLTEI